MLGKAVMNIPGAISIWTIPTLEEMEDNHSIQYLTYSLW